MILTFCLQDSSIIIQLKLIIMIGKHDDSTIRCHAWMNVEKNQLKMKLMWVSFMFGFISFTLGLILFYKFYDEKWQQETLEMDSSYKIFNRNRVHHWTFEINSAGRISSILSGQEGRLSLHGSQPSLCHKEPARSEPKNTIISSL